jgi:serine/threonine protein kinase
VERKEEIGRGSFGTTFLGKCKGAIVAIKCARIQKDQDATAFLRELGALSNVRHANIMALRGKPLKDLDGVRGGGGGGVVVCYSAA